MEEREFHLCRESWIYVMEQDYQVKEVTLIDALVNADKYRGLAGETETQNIAIIRFLLAVLHTVFSRQNEKGEKVPIDTKEEALRRWGAMWEMGCFPRKLIEEYFAQWEDRFWLFDYKYPFYQVPGIEGTNNPAKKMNGAIVESSNKIQLSQLKFLYPLKTLVFPAFSPPRFGPFPSFFPLREEMRETFFRPSLQPYPAALRKFAWPLWWRGRKCSSWYLHQNVPAAPAHPWGLPREREGWSYMYASTDESESHPYPRFSFGSIGTHC